MSVVDLSGREPASTSASIDVSPERIAELVASGVASMQECSAENGSHTEHLLSEARSDSLLVQVTHDMRSPLSSMMVLLDRLRSGQAGPVTVAQERLLGLLYSSTLGLATLTSDALDTARGSSQLVRGMPINFSVSDVFASVRKIVQPIAEERSLTMRWSAAGDDRVCGYPGALHRTLTNLVTNALKNTQRGVIDVAAEPSEPDHVAFTVRDTGAGVPDTVLAGLQVGALQDSQNAFSSAGLGLGICTKLVHEMSGSLSICNNPGGGTTCRFTIPLPAAT